MDDYPRIKADFVLSSKQDHLKAIGQTLSLEPTELQTADQILRDEHKAYSWVLSTGTQYSGDTSEQLEELTDMLTEKTKILQELIKQYELESLFIVTMIVEGSCDDTMGLIVSTKVIDFAAAIGAEVHMGVYVN